MVDSHSLTDIQRLADRAVHRFGRTPNLSNVEMNHLKAHISQIESAYSTLVSEVGNIDVLQQVSSQLSLLKEIWNESKRANPRKMPSLSLGDTSGDEESDESNNDTGALLPQAKPAKESRFANNLKQRPAKKPQDIKQDAKSSIFREEHDGITEDMLGHTAVLKANSNRLAELLRDEGKGVEDAEQLIDATQGSFAGHTKKLDKQVKSDSWGVFKVLFMLIVGFMLFIFMYLFIRLT